MNIPSSAALVPAEWTPQKAIWTCWPSHKQLWPGVLLSEARAEVTRLVSLLGSTTPCFVLACGDEAVTSATAAVGEAASIVPARFGDIWLRDTGPIFTRRGDCLRFATNGWGGKYLYEFDDEVGDTVAAFENTPVTRFDYVLEGGALEHNGEGVILSTRQCLLNPNRNQWSEAEATKALTEAFEAGRICWLDDGLLYDHTDGHVDNLARFVDNNTVVCQKPFGDDDPNASLYEKTATDLRKLRFEVIQVPSPGLIRDRDNAIMPASHMNFVISNDVVVVPVYGSDSASLAVAALAELFPGRKVEGVRANALLTGGGSFHCITQQQPQTRG